MSWKQWILSVIDKHGVSLAEFIVLDEVRYRIPLPANEFARFAVTECSHLDEVTFSPTDYEDAIDSCVQKGWVRILTLEDLEDVTDIGTKHSFPNLSYMGYDEGSVDFTPIGFQLSCQITKELLEARKRRWLRKYDVVRIVRLAQRRRRFHGTFAVSRPPQLGDIASIVHTHDPNDPDADVVLEMLDENDGSTVWLADFWTSELELVTRPE